jgi:hypothetical protein
VERSTVPRRFALALTVCICAGLPGIASAAQTARLDVKLTPERLGAGTTIIFGFQINGGNGKVPSPLTEIDLSYPANLGVGTSGLGFDTCPQAKLEAQGPEGCPADSRMGYGSALVEVPFGPLVIRETATIRAFSAPVTNGRLALLFYASGESPIYAQLVFPAVIENAQAPFGGSLNTTLPLVPSVPEAPDAAVVRLRATIGPLNLTYYEKVRGRSVGYQPRGIVLPRTCPRGGFPFSASFSFQDGAHARATATVPCPKSHGAGR